MKKIIGLILAFTLLFGALSYADNDGKGEVEVSSMMVEGKVVYEDENLFSTNNNRYSTLSQPIMARGSFITYGKAVPETITAIQNGWYKKHTYFHATSISIPSGVSTTYTWEQTVTKDSERGFTVGGGIRAQGGVKFIAELEVHVDGEYSSIETLTINSGQTSSITANSEGSYFATWYMMAKRYNIYSKWEAYTIDKPNDKKIVKRYVAEVLEPTTALHLEVKSN